MSQDLIPIRSDGNYIVYLDPVSNEWWEKTWGPYHFHHSQSTDRLELRHGETVVAEFDELGQHIFPNGINAPESRLHESRIDKRTDNKTYSQSGLPTYTRVWGEHVHDSTMGENNVLRFRAGGVNSALTYMWSRTDTTILFALDGSNSERVWSETTIEADDFVTNSEAPIDIKEPITQLREGYRAKKGSSRLDHDTIPSAVRSRARQKKVTTFRNRDTGEVLTYDEFRDSGMQDGDEGAWERIDEHVDGEHDWGLSLTKYCHHLRIVNLELADRIAALEAAVAKLTGNDEEARK